MSRRPAHPVWVAVAALFMAGLGLFGATRALPSWSQERDDEISTIRADDQATVATPDRRVTRAAPVTAVADRGLGAAAGAVTALAALALAAGTVLRTEAPSPRRRAGRFGWTRRAPPAPAFALARAR